MLLGLPSSRSLKQGPCFPSGEGSRTALEEDALDPGRALRLAGDPHTS